MWTLPTSLTARARTPVSLLLVAPALFAASPEVQQQTLKAAFICHFLVLTRWPEPKAAVVIGVYGDSVMGNDLAAALPNSAGTLAIKVVRIRPEAPDWGSVNAIYIPSFYQEDVPAVVRRIGAAPILTIGDSPRFMEEGGVIGFVQEGGKLRFEVNQAMAARKGLQLSAKLLELAKSVKR